MFWSATPIKIFPAHNLPSYIYLTYFDGFYVLIHYLKLMHMIFLVVSMSKTCPSHTEAFKYFQIDQRFNLGIFPTYICLWYVAVIYHLI